MLISTKIKFVEIAGIIAVAVGIAEILFCGIWLIFELAFPHSFVEAENFGVILPMFKLPGSAYGLVIGTVLAVIGFLFLFVSDQADKTTNQWKEY